MTWVGIAFIAFGLFLVMIGNAARQVVHDDPAPIILVPIDPEPSHGGPITPEDFGETPHLGSPVA